MIADKPKVTENLQMAKFVTYAVEDQVRTHFRVKAYRLIYSLAILTRGP